MLHVLNLGAGVQSTTLYLLAMEGRIPPFDAAIFADTQAGIRTPGVIVNRGLDQKLYLHRDCKPITEIDFARERQLGFAMECEGGCGL